MKNGRHHAVRRRIGGALALAGLILLGCEILLGWGYNPLTPVLLGGGALTLSDAACGEA